MVRRRELLAYLIGAGLAGTILVGPYALRVVAGELFMPGYAVRVEPVVLLPIFWGIWNLLWARRHPPLSIGLWGTVLGLGLATGINLYLLAAGIWFRAAALLIAFLPVLYWLLWRLVVGPLNEALGVEGPRD
jgi:hypothetical protein